MSSDYPNFWRPLHALRFEDIDELRVTSAPESLRLDFKAWKFLQNPEKLREHLCAMANGSAAGGRFIFGAVTDAADKAIDRFEGRDGKALRQDVSRLRNAVFEVDPPVHLDLRHVALPGGGDLVVAEVRAADDGPHQVDGCYHIRRTDGIGRMSHLMVMAAAQRGRAAGRRAAFPHDVLAKDHFGAGRAVQVGVVLLPSHSGVPLVPAWDVDLRARLEDLLVQGGSKPDSPTPEGIRFTRNLHAIGAVQFDGVAWEVQRLVEIDSTTTPRQRLPIAELRSVVERMLRQLAVVLAALQPSLEFSTYARIWTLPLANGIVELLPEDKDSPVDHFEGFRQRQIPVDGLLLAEPVIVADLATNEELLNHLATRFCAQLPLYCHAVQRVRNPPP